jgi:hypothetical protein
VLVDLQNVRDQDFTIGGVQTHWLCDLHGVEDDVSGHRQRVMRKASGALAATLLWLTLTGGASAVEVPPEGSCQPRPVQWNSDAVPAPSDVIPPAFKPGEQIPYSEWDRLRAWLPEEVWERRDQFFFEGMNLEIGPCYRRYPVPAFFDDATRANAGHAKVDADGNLFDYSGSGLPFAPDQIADDAPDAALRWAWNYRYRYLAAGFRGPFRITQITKGGRGVEEFSGKFFFMPTQGVPGGAGGDRNERFAAGGRFEKPELARGLAWRQYQPVGVDKDYTLTDEVFVYVPDMRKVKRAPPQSAEGVYLPSYTRANHPDNGGMTMPDGQSGQVGSPSVGATEPLRKGFVGLVIRPNAYTWSWGGVRDVLAPANVRASGFPPDPARNFGPSGLSLASDRWEIRRAVVLNGVRKSKEGPDRRVQLWVDALTQQPLYWISRRSNGGIYEVGIFASRFSGDDKAAADWQGKGAGFGAMLPVGQSFTVAGEGGGWRRESYLLASEPPSGEEAQDILSVQGLQKQGH